MAGACCSHGVRWCRAVCWSCCMLVKRFDVARCALACSMWRCGVQRCNVAGYYRVLWGVSCGRGRALMLCLCAHPQDYFGSRPFVHCQPRFDEGRCPFRPLNPVAIAMVFARTRTCPFRCVHAPSCVLTMDSSLLIALTPL